MQPSKRDATDLTRSVGGLLLATGAVLLLIRKSNPNGWGDVAQLLVIAIPTAVLYLLGLGFDRREPASPSEPAEPWQSVLIVTALLLSPIVLLKLLQVVGADTNHPLYSAGVSACSGLLAGYAAWRARVSYAALLAGLAAILTWLFIWEKILSDPSANSTRWLLLAIAVGLLAVAALLARRQQAHVGELATAGGIAAVSAGLIGALSDYATGIFQSLPFGKVSVPLHTHATSLQSFGWNLYLLVAALALMWVGSRVRSRGLGYVGALGLLGFVLSVGVETPSAAIGQSPNTDITGWPLALLVLGVVALAVLSVSRRRKQQR